MQLTSGFQVSALLSLCLPVDALVESFKTKMATGTRRQAQEWTIHAFMVLYFTVSRFLKYTSADCNLCAVLHLDASWLAGLTCFRLGQMCLI